jgi:hypothetical protein
MVATSNGDFDLDTWLDGYEAMVVEAKVVQKAALISEHSRLELAWIGAKQAASDVMHDPAATEAEAALRACEAEIAASEKTFKFTGIGHESWQNLKRKHPPTQAQRDEGADVNLERWAPAVVAACSLEPKITVAQAETMMRKLPPGEFEKVFAAVGHANGEVAGAPKSVLAALIDRSRQSGGSSTTALPEGSPADDYSDTLVDPSPESSETTTD